MRALPVLSFRERLLSSFQGHPSFYQRDLSYAQSSLGFMLFHSTFAFDLIKKPLVFELALTPPSGHGASSP